MPEETDRIYRGSLLGDYNFCPAKCKWRWFHEPRLEPAITSDNLKTGSLAHECLDLWYKHSMGISLDERVMMYEYHLTSEQVVEEYTEGQIAEAKRLMDCLAHSYPTEEFTIVKPEVTLFCKLVEGVYLKVTLDGVIQLNTKKDKAPHLVFEHKTAKQAAGPLITGYLKSPQIIGYTWAAKQVLKLPIVGALFNFLVKTKVPQIKRLPTAISPQLQQRWLRNTLRTISAIEESLESGIWRENLSACYTLFGECAYLPLCTRYSKQSLANYKEAPEDPIREELVVQT